MNDTAIKNFAIWARRELISDVQKRCMKYGILEKGSLPGTADAIDGRVLTSAERQQRAELLRLAAAGGYRELVERAAYTWFNRLLAIRFMELNGRLPSHIRVLSGADGTFRPQALAEAMDLPLEALDQTQIAELVQRGDDEALFRAIFLAQCDELAACMPAVFDKIGGSMELLLPDGLLREGGIVEKLVTSIPEEDWREGVEIVGWMYQYYVSERKDEVFASFKKGKKAERESIAPATQLFTPNWIVRYLTENSLGRLWMLNRPDSELPKDMPYFVKPDEDAETEFKKISSPEDITVVDPACGSGHILVYAFELLSKMYIEDGYTGRDAARLILEKNLSGMEIDPRAGAMASFALTMKACELDSRFLRRGVSPRITVLGRVEFEPEELQYIENLRNRSELMDAAAHLDECGSLLTVSSEDLEAVARDLASLAGEETIFGGFAAEKLKRLQAELEPLSRRYDVVVANPPYMGSSNMNGWVSKWVKSNYPTAKSDLCTCFFERGQVLATAIGYISMITASSWMFISSFEKFRKSLLSRGSIYSMIQQSTHGYAGVTVPTTMFAYACNRSGVIGSYIRLEGFDRPQWQEPRALEALANPDCGWFYRADASSFEAIPGSPIAYWASNPILKMFSQTSIAKQYATFKHGMSTGKNDAVLRFWAEVGFARIEFGCKSHDALYASGKRFVPYNKGGEFRRWWGNQAFVLGYDRTFDALMDEFPGHRHDNKGSYFVQNISWSKISSGALAMRYFPTGFVYDVAGCSAFSSEERLIPLLALFNSNLCLKSMEFMSPTLNFEVGTLENFPVEKAIFFDKGLHFIAENNIELARQDWDSFEESWEFKKHPLI